ncbi:MAG: citramalate synthase [Thermoleophilia bacterium]|nr:citramalate synthase [Thermoleophilia bacterium]
MSKRIEIYDTTLRDGMQREGMSVSVDEKVQIALRLDRLGVHYIEGGFPGSNPKDVEFYQKMAGHRLRTAKLAAFGMTHKRGARPHQDPLLRQLLKVDTPVVTIVGKSWKLHTQKVLRVGLEENLNMIEGSVAFLRKKGREVFYDAEHFFDGYLDDPEYALRTLRTAVDAGASRVVLCDTNGATLPSQAAEIVARVVGEVGVPVGIHAHNDADCAVAVSLMAIEAGATQVQGTVNGYGERCGNANLISIIPALKLKMGLDCVSDRRLAELTETSHFVAEMANVSPETHQPYVGENAFAHKGGLHVSAALRDARTFEHVDPALVGNKQRILVSELAGRATVLKKAAEMGIDLAGDEHKETLNQLLKRLKEKEHAGYHYEVADASFELFLRRELGLHKPIIELDNFRIIVQKRKSAVISEAKIILKGDGRGELPIAFAEGNGPVNALDVALRKLLPASHPKLVDELSRIHLVNYKVRILNENQGTGAVTRVLLDSSDGHDSWGTIGVSENIIEASWEALVDSIEYGLVKRRRRR